MSILKQFPYAGLQPANGINTLSDYRQRYAYYRLDEGLQVIFFFYLMHCSARELLPLRYIASLNQGKTENPSDSSIAKSISD